jgi:uncharacterized membrane protein YuzA (DUF378 family)
MEMDREAALDRAAELLMVVGGLNWGLVGIADVDLVASLFGPRSFLSRLVYGLVGISAAWCLYRSIRRGQADARVRGMLARVPPFGG